MKQEGELEKICEKWDKSIFQKVMKSQVDVMCIEESLVWQFRETGHFPFLPTQQPVLIRKFHYCYLL